MTDNKNARTAEEIAADVDSGGRDLTGSLASLIPAICICWSVYQLYIASSVPSWTGLSHMDFLLLNLGVLWIL